MIHYVVAIYLGKRRNVYLNRILAEYPHRLIKMHLNALGTINVPLIKKVTFVISPCGNPELEAKMCDYAKTKKNSLVDVEVDAYVAPDNNYWSYSSWDYCMNKNIDDGMDFFLIEDDYAPTKGEFYMPFVNKMSDSVAYVSQFCTTVENGRYRASISNGLMNYNAAKKHYRTFGQCLHLPPYTGRKRTNAGVIGQILFLDNFKGLGYSIGDISDDYHQPFLTGRNQLMSFGNPKGEAVIEPFTTFLGNV